MGRKLVILEAQELKETYNFLQAKCSFLTYGLSKIQTHNCEWMISQSELSSTEQQTSCKLSILFMIYVRRVLVELQPGDNHCTSWSDCFREQSDRSLLQFFQAYMAQYEWILPKIAPMQSYIDLLTACNLGFIYGIEIRILNLFFWKFCET